MKKKAVKRVTYNFVLAPGIKKALEIAAVKDRRSMSSLLERLIINHLDEAGIPWSDAADDVTDEIAEVR